MVLKWGGGVGITILRTKLFYYLSLLLLISGILSWVPYLVFDIQKPYGMLTMILNSIGFYLGYLGRNRILALCNLSMVFSIVPVIIYVYLVKGYIPM